MDEEKPVNGISVLLDPLWSVGSVRFDGQMHTMVIVHRREGDIHCLVSDETRQQLIRMLSDPGAPPQRLSS